MRKIKKIVLHCSDSQDSLDIGVKEIRSWHTMKPPKGNGWDDIGYHFVIRRDGRIELGRPQKVIGAHVRGHNSDSIGVCWVGRKMASDKQLQSMYALLRGLIDKYDLEVEDIWGHSQFDSHKTCPNLDMIFVRAQTLFTLIGVNIDQL